MSGKEIGTASQRIISDGLTNRIFPAIADVMATLLALRANFRDPFKDLGSSHIKHLTALASPHRAKLREASEVKHWFSAVFRHFCVALFLLSAACSPSNNATAPGDTAASRPDAPQTIRYGNDPLQIVDLWLPETGKPPFPVALMIHGGCWKTGIANRTIMEPLARDLAKRGLAVWNIEYRGIDKGGGYPGTFEDVAAAADLLARDGAKYGLDPKRSVAIGHSAGGHLTLWVANRPALPAASRFRSAQMFVPRAAISQGGIPDLRELAKGDRCGEDGARALSADGTNFAETSPPEMTASDVPQFQVYGDQDRIAPPAFARSYEAKLAARGVTVRTFVVPGTTHMQLIDPTTEAWKQQAMLIGDALK